MKKLRQTLQLLSLKLTVELELLNANFRKGYTESLSREILFIDSVLKTKRWTCKVKILNGEKIIGSFYGKGLLLRMCLKMINN